MNVFRCLSLTVQATGLSTLSLRSVCAAERRVCLILSVTDPTESPGDEQRGVRRSARLEADELEESQRTFLMMKNWALLMSSENSDSKGGAAWMCGEKILQCFGCRRGL